MAEEGCLRDGSFQNVDVEGELRATKRVVPLTAAYTVKVKESGTIFTLGTAGGFTVTLPTPVNNGGFSAKFIAIVAPTTAYIIASGAADTMLGGFTTSEDAQGSVDSEVDGGADQINFVATLAVISDWVEVISDGTNYYCTGHCNVQDGLTLTG